MGQPVQVRSTPGWRLVAFAAVGYAYLLLILGVLGVSLFLSITRLRGPGWQLSFLIGGLMLLVIQAVMIRFEPPDGRPLRPEEAPDFFRILEHIRRQSGAPRIDAVVLNPQLNASVIEIPKFGYLGPAVRTLTLGMPLLEVLSGEETASILAHECAHLHFRHSARSAWLYRLALGWSRLLSVLESVRHPGAWVLRPFFHWYVPRFEEMAQAASRSNEFDSDAVAARITGPESTIAGLLRLHVMASYLDRGFWRSIYQQSRDHRDPIDGVHAGLARAAEGPFDPVLVSSLLAACLRQRATSDHSHPSLADRIAALRGLQSSSQADLAGLVAQLQRRPTSAALTWFSPSALAGIRRDLDWEWRIAVGQQWRVWHRAAAPLRASDIGAMSPADLETELTTATWTAACAPIEEALATLRSLHRRQPEQRSIALALGRLELAEPSHLEQANGAATLEPVLATQSADAFEAATLLEGAYLERGDLQRAATARRRANAIRRRVMRSLGERLNVSAADTLQPAPISIVIQQGLVEVLRAYHDVAVAYLVHKRLKSLPDERVQVLAIRFNTPWYRYEAEDRSTTLQKIADDLANKLGLDAVVVSISGERLLTRALAALPGAERYRPGASGPPSEVQPDLIGGRSKLARALQWLPVGMVIVTALFALRWLGIAEITGSADREWPTMTADERIRYGGRLADRGAVDSALTQFRRAVALEPSNASARHNLAWALAELSRHEEAIAEYDRAVKLDPRNGNLQANYAYSLLQVGRSREAYYRSLQGLIHAPDDGDVHIVVARAAFARGRHGESLVFLRKVTSAQSGNASWWALRAMTAYFTHRHDEAAWAMIRAKALDSTLANGEALPALKEIDQSLERDGMYAIARAGKPAFTPFSSLDRRNDSINDARLQAVEAKD